MLFKETRPTRAGPPLSLFKMPLRMTYQVTRLTKRPGHVHYCTGQTHGPSLVYYVLGLKLVIKYLRLTWRIGFWLASTKNLNYCPNIG